MTKDNKTQKKSAPTQTGNKLMVRVEYVGIIAVACLVIGAIIGSSLSDNNKKIMVETGPSTASANMASAMPSQEEVDHLMQQIGNTTNYEALVRMGNAAMDQRMSAVAVAAYEKALSIHPDDPNVITDLGAVYRDQMQQSEKAIELFKRAAKLDPKHIQSRYNLGIASLDIHDHETAEKSFKEVIKIAPTSPQSEDAKQRLKELEAHEH